MNRTMVLNEERNVTLSAFLHEDPDAGKLPAVLILPGGGYTVCADAEADPPAKAFYAAGFQAFVLRYTVGKQCIWPLPLEDYEQAMETIENHAEDWHVDHKKIAIAGFSAGGHLAACAMTTAGHRPAAAILVYPAVLTECMSRCPKGAPSPADLVTDENCPCFLIAARDDDMVDIGSTLAMLDALKKHNVPFESHIYSRGGHAFGTGESSPFGHDLTPRLAHWTTEAAGWLLEMF